MTLENFIYRTNPLFLRNQFNSDNMYGIPNIPSSNFEDDELLDLKLLAFNQVPTDNEKHLERIVHFFLYDYNFEKIWINPNNKVEILSKYKGVLTPDFSMYLEMPYALQIYNTFRNRWCGAFFADKGLRVIPTVSWSDEKSFDFCFEGIEKGSIVAVSTYMFHDHNYHSDQKDVFMNGYNKMLEKIEPSKIICYSEPFSEMKGNIIYIDYELSSWRHLNDSSESTKSYLKHTNSILAFDPKYYIIKKTGFVCKGGGSAFGGKWKPKNKNSERFLGKPNSTKQNHVSNKNDGYHALDKYDENGRAIYERHYFTDHGRSDKHSNPHDHKINWDNGYPSPGPPINYPDGNIPEFKKYKTEVYIMEKTHDYDPEDFKFETLGEFKLYLNSGWNIGFKWHGVEYGIEGHNNSFNIWTYHTGDIANDLTLEQTLNYKLDGVKIRNLILNAEIIEKPY